MSARPYLYYLAHLRRNRCGVLLAALCLFLVTNPLMGEWKTGATLVNIALLAILVLAVWALRVQRRTAVVVVILGLVAAASVASARTSDELVLLKPATILIVALFIAVVTIALLNYVLDWHPITADKVFGAVSAYVLIALTFALIFGLVQLVRPDAFHVSDVHDSDGHLGWMGMMYFSFTVLTSTGFGDITPVSDTARSLIVIEQVVGVMYVAFLIARLANLYDRRGREGGER